MTAPITGSVTDHRGVTVTVTITLPDGFLLPPREALDAATAAAVATLDSLTERPPF